MRPAQPVALAAVPEVLFADVPFQSSRAWWACVAEAGLPPDIPPRFLLAEQDGAPAGLLPLRPATRWTGAGLETPYTTLFQPLLAADADPRRTALALGRGCGDAVLRFTALDPDWSAWPGLLDGFAAAGWRAAWFDSFGNWHEQVRDWDGYLAARPGALRETIRRRLRRAERDPAMEFTLARTPAEAIPALAAYEAVYARSWKQPEPFPRFAAAFVAAAAAAGVLRLGVLTRDGVPLAAQYWTVEHGVATVLKLAHDEAAKQHSPGTALTAWMVRGLLAEGVRELDFGRGDDPYKQQWVAARRQRRGLLLARPTHPVGAATLLRQAAGRWRRRFTVGSGEPI